MEDGPLRVTHKCEVIVSKGHGLSEGGRRPPLHGAM